MAKVYYITWITLRQFYHFIAKLMDKSHSPQWDLANIFQISEQNYTKTETIIEFHIYKSF